MGGVQPIVVYGATGFTGKLVVAQLVKQGAKPIVIAGRNPEKLQRLSELHGGLEQRVADVSDPKSLSEMAKGAAVIIDTVGPFTKFGEPVVQAALDAGSHFVDVSGEQAYIAAVLDRFNAEAEAKQRAVISSLAFEFALGCCAGAWLLEEHPEIDTLDVFNWTASLATSRGTRRSALSAIQHQGWILQDGVRKNVARVPAPRRVEFPESGRSELAAPFPGAEAIHLPRWYPQLKHVTTSVVLPKPVVSLLSAAWVFRPLVARVQGTGPVQRLEQRLIGEQEGPDENQRNAQSFTVYARGQREGKQWGLSVRGSDPYGVTAALVAWGAATLRQGEMKATGVVSPDRAFGSQALLGALAPQGVRVTWDT